MMQECWINIYEGNVNGAMCSTKEVATHTSNFLCKNGVKVIYRLHVKLK